MKVRFNWLTGFFIILAIALIAGCGGSNNCPDMEGTITGTGEAATVSQGKVKISDGGDSVSWTASNTGYKAIDGVTVKGKIDKPGQGAATRNIMDAKADLKGDYDKCQLVVTGSLTGPGSQKTCQGSGDWQVTCNGASKASGTWQVGAAAKQTPEARPESQTAPPSTTQPTPAPEKR